jgi:hypothetical protein
MHKPPCAEQRCEVRRIIIRAQVARDRRNKKRRADFERYHRLRAGNIKLEQTSDQRTLNPRTFVTKKTGRAPLASHRRDRASDANHIALCNF